MKTITNIISYIFAVLIGCALIIYLQQDKIDNIAKSNPSVMREDLIEEM